MEERQETHLVALIALMVSQHERANFGFENFFVDRHRGRLLTEELLYGHKQRFFESTRMKPETFDNLILNRHVTC
jgi:hypothetical protein